MRITSNQRIDQTLIEFLRFPHYSPVYIHVYLVIITPQMGAYSPSGAICIGCNTLKPRDELRLNKLGQIKERICRPCRAARVQQLKNRWAQRLQFKKTYCERCGFRGHPCQLDVDHIDGNHSNDTNTNYQTLCANCHRLKTFRANQGIWGITWGPGHRPHRAWRIETSRGA